eukprot:6204298-Alexandrium_andersonii.AAC.1
MLPALSRSYSGRRRRPHRGACPFLLPDCCPRRRLRPQHYHRVPALGPAPGPPMASASGRPPRRSGA